jgi:hypothetical protein
MTAQTLSPQSFTVADRCDRCGAQAFFRAVFVNGDLTFCGHHGRELLVPLQREAILVEDATEQINAAPSISANQD